MRRGIRADEDGDDVEVIHGIGDITQLTYKKMRAPRGHIGFHTPPVDLTCTDHPRYEGKRKPTHDCAACRRLWNAMG